MNTKTYYQNREMYRQLARYNEYKKELNQLDYKNPYDIQYSYHLRKKIYNLSRLLN